MPSEAKKPLFTTSDKKISFSSKPFGQKPAGQTSWKILVVDDDPEVHEVTKLALRKFKFREQPLDILSAYSGSGAKHLIQAHPDAAVILLDVVMEDDNAGLGLVKYIRDVLQNHQVRIILRTGQPGQAPEKEVILEYDINDYKLKTEMTSQKLFTTLVTALRSYHQTTLLAERTAELKRANEKLQQEISDRKRAEAALKTYTTELERNNRELWKKMMLG